VKPAGVRRSTPPRRRQKNWVLRGLLACVALVVGIFAWAALARATAPRANTSQSQFDVLIVLGNPADDDGNPSPTQQSRVVEAVHEYERGTAPRIIMTGGAVANQYVEAEVMARTAEAQGIPADAVVEETHARNTIENACNSLRIMRSHGWESAEVITSPSHAPRAAIIFSRLPLKWRMQSAPPLEPESEWTGLELTATEIFKTVHYLVMSRQTEPCELAGNGQ
jgi:uncharacterized SAM-binding protein YcdF (DUF218 family)